MGEKTKKKKHSRVDHERTKNDEEARGTNKKHKKARKVDVDGVLQEETSIKKLKLDLKAEDEELNEELMKTTSKKEKKRHHTSNNDEATASKKEKKKKSSKIKQREKEETPVQKQKKGKEKKEDVVIDKDGEDKYSETVISLNEEASLNEMKKMKKKKKESKEIKSFEEYEKNLSGNEDVPKEKKSTKKKSKEKKNSDNIKEEESDKEFEGAAHQALLYLHTWKNNRSKWTFKKVRQVWLLKNMFDNSKIPDEDFTILLEYLEGLKGTSRETTIGVAESIINNESDNVSVIEVKLERARRLLQMLT